MRQSRISMSVKLIWGTAFAAVAAGSWTIYHRMMERPPAVAPDPAIERLQPVLAGASLEVPAAPGFWLRDAGSTQVLANLGEPDGASQRLDLCPQRTRAMAGDHSIFAIRSFADWEQLRGVQAAFPNAADKGQHQPLVFPAGLKAALPALSITGQAGDSEETSTLTIGVAGTGPWRLLTDDGAGALRRPSAARAFKRHAWLLWGAMPSTEDGGGATRFAHALHIQRNLDAALVKQQRRTYEQQKYHCGAGYLDFTLLSARAGTAQPRGLGVALSVFPEAGGMRTARMASGPHVFPALPPEQMEDQQLFTAAMAHGLIRLNRSGRIEMAPADLVLARKAGVRVPGWERVDPASADVAQLLKRLYGKRDGDFVRAQVRRFNTREVWAAVTVRARDAALLASASDVRGWDAQVDGQGVATQAGLPPVAARLFREPLAGWGPWIRPAMPTMETRAGLVQLALSLPPGGARQFEVMSLGKIVSVRGATAGPGEDACLGRGCAAPDVVRRTPLVAESGAKVIELTLTPEPRFGELRPESAQMRHIQLRDDVLTWVPAPAPAATGGPAKVVLTARDGSPLFQNGQPSPSARALGLLPVVGVSAAHANSVAGMLGRLGEHGRQQVSARLTIDPAWQDWSRQVLDCVGDQGGTWNAVRRRCDLSRAPGPVAGRRTAVVVMDAENGAVLALAGTPQVPENADADALIDAERESPGDSVLRPAALHHNHSNDNAPGSGSKLFTALGLELAALTNPRLNALLDGATAAEINSAAARTGTPYSFGQPCYPVPCGDKSVTDKVNGVFHPPRLNENGRFGLREALATSPNSWFTWVTELSDATVAAGVGRTLAGAIPLGGTGLDMQRPVVAMAHRLGVGRALRLDGGLLPADYRWQLWDALRATPSEMEFPIDIHQVRRYGIGAHMYVSALQMAVAAGSIGQGTVVQPRLLAELDGVAATVVKGEPLGVRLDRIRAGMKAVPESGTAKHAFKGDQMRRLRTGVYAKTGTVAAADGTSKQNVGWLIGFIEPNTIPGEGHRLAFAAYISKTTETGGNSAGEVIAGLLATMAAKDDAKDALKK